MMEDDTVYSPGNRNEYKTDLKIKGIGSPVTDGVGQRVGTENHFRVSILEGMGGCW
jgi:hypothetical protein